MKKHYTVGVSRGVKRKLNTIMVWLAPKRVKRVSYNDVIKYLLKVEAESNRGKIGVIKTQGGSPYDNGWLYCSQCGKFLEEGEVNHNKAGAAICPIHRTNLRTRPLRNYRERRRREQLKVKNEIDPTN